MMRQCAHEACGQAFEAKRADARFCSGSCRAAASRARRAGAVDVEGGEGTAVGNATSEAAMHGPAAQFVNDLDAGLVARLASVEARVATLAKRLRGQRDSARELVAGTRELGLDRDAINVRLSGLDGRVEDLLERLESLESAAEARSGEVEHALRILARRLAEQAARIAAVDEAASQLVNMIADVG